MPKIFGHFGRNINTTLWPRWKFSGKSGPPLRVVLFPEAGGRGGGGGGGLLSKVSFGEAPPRGPTPKPFISFFF